MSLSGPHGFRRTAVDTEQKFTLMEQVRIKPGSDGLNHGVYVYAQANGAIAAGEFCILTYLGQAIDATTTDSGSVGNIGGVAQAALADNEYGWFWRGDGVTEAMVETGTTAGLILTTTATAGTLGTGGDRVLGAFAIDANSSGSDALATIAAYALIGTN